MTDDLYYHTWTAGTNDAHYAPNWYVQAANNVQWNLSAHQIRFWQGGQWIMSNGSTISWASEPKPEPIDPDLLMDEGL